ncbi:MAG: class I SAM-dependent methyltransferase [Bdellovibrionales bacterium]|nr:class I SAM-dependent methyltransferase [Bdellovibrionales bacterium]
MDSSAAKELQGAKWRMGDWFAKQLTDDQLHDLRLFHVELFNFSTKLNLISLNTLMTSDEMHFADSVLASKIVLSDFKGRSITDIGSGNGFPGMVLAILDRTLKVSFIESRGKRVEFLKHTANRLRLSNVEILHTRVEDIPEGALVGGISRAFATLPNALLNTRKTFAVNAPYYHMKTDGWASEVANVPHQLCSTWNIQHVADYKLPVSQMERTVLKATKVK